MSHRTGAGDNSPSASTLDLPRSWHSRRGSIASLNSTSQLDKDAISQTLDQINQHASQTDTLTTFNEYTSPPSSSSGGEGKGLAGELQGGLSGLYSRFRASVGNVREKVSQSGDNGSQVEKSIRTSGSPKLFPPSPSTATGSKPHSLRNSVSAAVSAHPRSPHPSSPTFPQSREDNPSSTRSSDGRLGRPTNLVLGNTGIPGIALLTPNVPLKSPLAPSARPTTIVNPAIAEAVSVTDSKEDSKSQVDSSAISEVSKLRTEERLTTASSKQRSLPPLSEPSTDLTSDVRKDDYSNSIAERTADAAKRIKERSTSQAPRGVQDAGAASEKELDYFTSPKQPLEPPEITTHASTPQRDLPRTPENAGKWRNDLLDPTLADNMIETPSPIADPTRPPTIPSASIQSPSNSQQSLLLKKSNVTTARATSARINIPNIKHHRTDHAAKSAAPASKNRLLDKEYWMKDENARDCFYCGASFSTFRRKHHC
ncbi:MAG: hypothetical protein Q9174_003810, partial [Haloplaca sp. 1 TL-2023]